MSNYRYANKKSAWKWTPAKIAAFSVFGLMMAALIYFETTANRNVYDEPVQITQQPAPLAASSDFEKEYQEFLSKGEKIVPQEMLDSLNAIETPEPELIETPAPASTNNPAARPTTQESSSTTPAARKPVIKSSAKSKPSTNQNNRLEITEQPAASEIRSSSRQDRASGTLVEAEPVVPERNTTNRSNNASGKVIVEEFYTEETITGKVSSMSDGTPLQGVSISVNGTPHKAVTNQDGTYSITVPGDPQFRTIHYNYLGNVTERDVSPGAKVVNIRF